MQTMRSTLQTIAFCLFFISIPGIAATTQSAGTAAASQPQTPGVSLHVYVTAVNGLVQVRDSETDPWHLAQVNMILTEGAELRTGPHSSVTCVIPPDQTFTLDRLGTVRVQDAFRTGDKVKTDLIMKYGRTHYDIQSAGLQHQSTITSPSSTLAVRGTDVVLFDQVPFNPYAISYTGRALYTYGHNTVGVGTKHGSYAKAAAGSDGAAETGVSETVVDPQYAAALTAADSALLATEVARGAVVYYNPATGFPTVAGGRPQYDSELPAGLPGTLDFVLRWTGNANLNIEVGVDPGDPLQNILNGFQKVEFLYPSPGLNNSPSGGHIPYDDIGGPTGGEEIAYWLGPHPQGLYGIGAQSISGVATSFTFNAYENGQPLEMFYFASDGVTLIKSIQMTNTLQPGAFATALIPVPDQPILDQIIPDDPNGNPNPGIGPGSFSNSNPTLMPAVRAAAMGIRSGKQ
jgi:hypothetical protein